MSVLTDTTITTQKMTIEELQLDRGTCRQCGGTSKQWLMFRSALRGTRIWLCDDCFENIKSIMNRVVLENLTLPPSFTGGHDE